MLLFSLLGKLYEGKEYLFRVAAENSVGLGNFAELTTAVLTKPAVSEYSLPCYCIIFFSKLTSDFNWQRRIIEFLNIQNYNVTKMHIINPYVDFQPTPVPYLLL